MGIADRAPFEVEARAGASSRTVSPTNALRNVFVPSPRAPGSDNRDKSIRDPSALAHPFCAGPISVGNGPVDG